MTEQSIYTLAVHAGERSTETTPLTGPGAGRTYQPVVTPVHHSVGYTYEDTEDLDAVFAGASDNPVYTRYGNPTVNAFEAAVAALEGGAAALAYGSGMAALHGALLAAGARAGTAVVAAQDVYGATYALLDRLLATQGVTVRFVDVADLGAVSAALEELQSGRAPGRDRLEPAAQGGRLARTGAAQPRGRRSVHRRQHVRDAGALPAALAGRGLRGPQRHQIPGRPRRRPGRRCGGGQRERRASRSTRSTSCSARTWRPRRPGWRTAGSRRCPCAWSASAATRRSWPGG